MLSRVPFAEVRSILIEVVVEIPWGKVIKYLILPIMLYFFVKGFVGAIVDDDEKSAVKAALTFVMLLLPILLAAGLVERFKRAMFEPSDNFRPFAYGFIFTTKVLLIDAVYYLIGIILAPYGYGMPDYRTMWAIFLPALIFFAVTALVIHNVKYLTRSIAKRQAAVMPSS